MTRRAVRLALLLSLALACMALGTAVAAGETYAVYGADTTPAQRDAITRLAHVSAPASTDTVSSAEIADAVQGTGLPANSSEGSVASAVVTCQNPGDGLTVETQNITRLTAPVYAGTLLAAGVDGARVLIAAPPEQPVAGETALVPVLKAFSNCRQGQPLDAARVDLGYKQVAWTLALAGSDGNVEQTSNMLLRAEAPIIAGQTSDTTAVSKALDAAASSEGMTVPAAMRPTLVEFLNAFQHRDYGAYAKGFSIQRTSADEATLVAGAAAPPQAPGFTGVVEHSGRPLTVRLNGQDVVLLTPAADAVVTRDGHKSSLGALRKGDHVQVVTNPDGTAQRIDASSAGGGFGGWQWLAVALFVLGGLLLLAALTGGREDGFILEPKPGRALPPG